MSQQATKKDYSTFIKGIITEAGPLTFPEDASLDEENCVLNRDGSRQRRLGMDLEADAVLQSVTVLSDDAVASFRWYNAANSPNNQLVVVQAGQKLLVFDGTEASISASLLTTIDISAYTTGKTPIQVASGLGYLFVTGGKSKPFYLKYNPTTQAVTLTAITINIRDFFGVDDGLAVTTQPGTLSTAHNYNLLNQGWTSGLIGTYFGIAGRYPSNANIWFVGKDSSDNFDPVLMDKQDFGSSPAPKGRFVIDAFARSTSRDTLSGLTTTADIETSYPTTVAFSFERVFYAGIESVQQASETVPNYTGMVFYSRILRNIRDAGQCHSDADPTSEVDSALVETDGGFVNIPDSGKIHKLIPKGSGVIVLAEKGIWGIFGGQGGFIATDYQVVKLSDFGVLTASAVVDVEDRAFYWNRGGIYLLAPGESGFLEAKNISEGTIQTLYNEINQPAKKTAVGSYDPINRRVQWMYNDEEDYDGVSYRNQYNRELVLDMVLGSFYKNSISAHETPSPYIAGYVETPDFLLREEGIRTRGESVTKYLVVQFLNTVTNDAAVSFSYYRDPTFRDWKSVDGVGTSFISYLITGYEIMGDTARQKQSPYIICHFKQTEKTAVMEDGELTADNPSGCYLQAQWDWSNSSNSGKWGTQFQVYRLQRPYILPAEGESIDYGYEVVSTKNRLPGRGKAVSLYFKSDGDKDFYLYGWSMRFTGNIYV